VDVSLEPTRQAVIGHRTLCSPCTAIVEILVFARIFIFVVVLKKVGRVGPCADRSTLVQETQFEFSSFQSFTSGVQVRSRKAGEIRPAKDIVD
jgi:hypothetical protein